MSLGTYFKKLGVNIGQSETIFASQSNNDMVDVYQERASRVEETTSEPVKVLSYL